jgi:hypothetical protein
VLRLLPESYRRMAEAMRTFPDPPTTDLLRARRHDARERPPRLLRSGPRPAAARDGGSGEFQRVAGDEQALLYRLLARA